MDVIFKPIALAIAGCLAFTGCEAFHKSTTWEKVMKVRPDTAPWDPDSSNAYATKLHRVLRAETVEHKIVTYQFHYRTHLREEAVHTRTAVLYRDSGDPNNLWWLMEDRLAKPVWVPGENPQKQVAFYLRHDAEVVEEKNYETGPREHKAMVALARTPDKGAPAAAGVRFRLAPAADHREVAAMTPKASVSAEPYAARFRALHGTEYDSSSQMDREKMALLRGAPRNHPLAASETRTTGF